MNCGEETVIPLHAHIDWFELTVVKAGEGEITTGDKKAEYQAETYTFLSPVICTK